MCFGDHSEHIKYINFSFVQGADGLKIMTTNSTKINPRYFYHACSSYYVRRNNYERHFKYFCDTIIPVPPLPVQEEIVRILDSFAELTAELAARHKQYEHYKRDIFERITPQENSVPLKEVATFSQGIQVEPKDQFLDMIPGRVRFLRIVDFVSENEPLRYIAQPNVKYIKTDQELVMIRYLESCLQRGSMVRSCKSSSGARTDHAKSSSLLQRRCVRLSGPPWLSL